MKQPKLADLLASELSTMEPQQKKQFKRELSRVLPQAVKSAAQAAKIATEKPQGKDTSENVRKK